MKRRAIVEIISAIKEQDTRPTAYIDTVKGGEYVYGVRTSAPTLKLARQRAVEEFRALMADVEKLKDEKLLGELGHGRA